MRALLFLLPIFLVLESCGPNTKHTERPEGSSEVASAYRLESLPDSVAVQDGCGDAYSLQSSNDSSDGVVFESNFEEAAIKVSGSVIRLKRVTNSEATLPNRHHLQYYEGSGFKVVLDVTEKRAYDEGGWYEGTLRVSNRSFDSTYKIEGESGC